MFVKDLFLDPTLRLICNAEGDNLPEGGAGSDPPKPPGATPPPKDAAGDAPKGDEAPLDPEAARSAGWTKEALEKQVARQHRKMKEQEAQLAELAEIRAENQRLQDLARTAANRGAIASDPNAGDSARATPPSPPPPPAPATTDMKALREQAKFDVQVEALTEQVKGNYATDWPVAYENYSKVIGSNTQVMNEIVAQVLATDDPAYVLVTLGKDPSKLQDVLDMSGPKRQAALIRMAMDKPDPKAAEPPKRPSGAPPPPSGDHQRGGAPPSGSGLNLYDEKLEFKNYAGNLDAEKDADEAWYAERQRLKRESKGRPWSIGR